MNNFKEIKICFWNWQIFQTYCDRDVRRTPNREPEFFPQIKDYCDKEICSVTFHVDGDTWRKVEGGIEFTERPYCLEEEKWNA